MSWYLNTSGGTGETINFVDGDLSGNANLPKVIHKTEVSKDLVYSGDSLTNITGVASICLVGLV